MIFDIGVVCVLSYSMFGVNKQLALFFKQVGMKGYLKKSIEFFIAAFFFIVIHWDVMRILGYFIEVNKIYYFVAGYLDLIIYPLLFLFVTLVFFFLADLGWETRTTRVRPAKTQRKRSVYPNINISTAN